MEKETKTDGGGAEAGRAICSVRFRDGRRRRSEYWEIRVILSARVCANDILFFLFSLAIN